MEYGRTTNDTGTECFIGADPPTAQVTGQAINKHVLLAENHSVGPGLG